jgi:hypothetical protein
LFVALPAPCFNTLFSLLFYELNEIQSRDEERQNMIVFDRQTHMDTAFFKELVARANLMQLWHEDLEDEESEASEFVAFFAMRFILEHLSSDERKHLVRMLTTEDPQYEDVYLFIQTNIPDFEIALGEALGEKMRQLVTNSIVSTA